MKNYIWKNYHRIAAFLFLFFLNLYHPVSNIYAADKGLGCDSKNSFGLIAKFLCDLSPGDTNKNTQAVGDKVNQIISSLIGFLTMIAGLWFLIQIIVAGYQWIAASGDGKQVQAAREKITNSLIGLIIVVIAWIIVGLIGELLGLNILNPGDAIKSLIIKNP